MKMMLMIALLTANAGAAAQNYAPTSPAQLAALEVDYMACVLEKSRKVPATITEPARDVAGVLARGCGWEEFVGTVEVTYKKAAGGGNVDRYMSRIYAKRDGVIEAAALNITEARMARAGQ